MLHWKSSCSSPPESLRLPITDIKSDHITEERTVTALDGGVDGGGIQLRNVLPPDCLAFLYPLNKKKNIFPRLFALRSNLLDGHQSLPFKGTIKGEFREMETSMLPFDKWPSGITPAFELNASQ